MKLKILVGSGDKIGLLTLPFLIIGLILNIIIPSIFSVGGPSIVLKTISIIILIPGMTIWIWLTKWKTGWNVDNSQRFIGIPA